MSSALNSHHSKVLPGSVRENECALDQRDILMVKKHLLLFQRTQAQFLNPHDSSQLSVSPVSRDPVPFSDFCAKTFPGEMQQKHLLTPDRKSTTEQSVDTTKVQLGEPIKFIWVT